MEFNYPSFHQFVKKRRQDRMKIPASFIKNYGNSVGDTVLLIDTIGDTWEATVAREGGHRWVTQLRGIVDHYRVEVGWLIVFTLVGPSLLLVTIFNGNLQAVRSPGRLQ